MPDFRAAERTFQLLTQVAGRAGRGDVPGDVYIQTFAPFHPAVQCARNSDYQSFYDQEIVFRREMGYPPYTRLTVVRFTGKDEGAVNAAARALGEALEKAGIPEDVRVNGPAPAALAKAKGQYRVQLFLWGKAVRDTSRLLWEAMKGLAVPKGVSVGVNVDAGSVM